MPCFSPLTGYRPRDGTAKLTFKASEGYHDKPVKIACGQCKGCRLERARQWAIRIMHEAQMHECNSFLTLTYSDEEIPADRSVNKRHFQLFMKRLRKSFGKKIRFYHCGEYGSETDRPHYHSIIFGEDFMSSRILHKHTRGNHELFTSEKLDKLWTHGHVYIGDVTQQSAAYVARYCMKKLIGDDHKNMYGERVDADTGEIDFYRQPPYSTMSTRPGIGATWYSQFKSDVYPSDEVIHDGQKTRPPVYYDRLLAAEEPETLEMIKLQRRKNGNLHKSNNTPERLAVREEIHIRKQKFFKRDAN